MAWQTPKTNWTPEDAPTDADFNRIEGNVEQNREDLDQLRQDADGTEAALNTHKTKATLDHPDGSVTASKLANNAVTESKIASGAVTSGKLANLAVTAGKIANGAIDTLARIASSIRTSPGGTDPNRLAVTDDNGAVGLAKDTQAVGGVSASGIARIATGSYVGDGSTSDRLIHVGFAPLMVYVVGNSSAGHAGLGLGMAEATYGIAKLSSSDDLQKQHHNNGRGVPVPTENGFIVRSSDTLANLNSSGTTYTWVAIGAVGA